MISVTQLRAGTTFKEKGEPFLVLKYEHTNLARGKASIRVRVKNLKTGAASQKVFVSGTKVEEIQTSKRKLQYLYQDGQDFCFMDPKTFEQYAIQVKVAGDQASFLQEESVVDVLFLEGEPLALELPAKITLEVTQAPPGAKGNSATNVFKEATLGNGSKVKVPLFIKVGEKVVIDTRTGEYVERAKS